MSDYYLYSVILKNCPYSMAAYNLLKTDSKIKKKFLFVDNYNKEKYKTDMISTFPQIYLKRYNKNGSLLIGGYSDLKILFNLFYKKKYSDNDVEKFITDNSKWSKKSLLRFIQLINQ